MNTECPSISSLAYCTRSRSRCADGCLVLNSCAESVLALRHVHLSPVHRGGHTREQRRKPRVLRVPVDFGRNSSSARLHGVKRGLNAAGTTQWNVKITSDLFSSGSEGDWTCVTARREVKVSSLPFTEEKSCSTWPRSCRSQRATRSRSVPVATFRYHTTRTLADPFFFLFFSLSLSSSVTEETTHR